MLGGKEIEWFVSSRGFGLFFVEALFAFCWAWQQPGRQALDWARGSDANVRAPNDLPGPHPLLGQSPPSFLNVGRLQTTHGQSPRHFCWGDILCR